MGFVGLELGSDVLERDRWMRDEKRGLNGCLLVR